MKKGMQLKTKRSVAIGIVLTSFLVVGLCRSQEGFRKPKQGATVAYFSIGSNTLNLAELNTSLVINGHPQVSNNVFQFGGGVYGTVSKLIVGAKGHFLIGSRVTEGDFSSKFSASSFIVHSGFLAYSKKAFKVYALLGFGYGGVKLELIEKILDPSGTPKEMRLDLGNSGFLLNLALGTDLHLIFDNYQDVLGAIILGIRVGYTFALFDWTLDGLEIHNHDDPTVNPTGPYVNLILGFGGTGKDE